MGPWPCECGNASTTAPIAPAKAYFFMLEAWSSRSCGRGALAGPAQGLDGRDEDEAVHDQGQPGYDQPEDPLGAEGPQWAGCRRRRPGVEPRSGSPEAYDAPRAAERARRAAAEQRRRPVHGQPDACSKPGSAVRPPRREVPPTQVSPYCAWKWIGGMVGPIHPNHDAVERADPGHSVALRFRRST